MSLSAFVIRLVFLALPGILASKIYRKLRGRTKKDQWESVLEIAILAVASYILVIPFVLLIPALGSVRPSPEKPPLPYRVYALNAFVDDSLPVPPWQVLTALVAAIPVAGVASYIHKNRWVTRAGRARGVTHRMADEDVWELLFSDPDTDWVLVRDHKQCLAYYGQVLHFSESGEEREIVLTDAAVADNLTGKHLYVAPSALSQLDFRVDAAQFCPGVADLHLPIDAFLAAINVAAPG